MICLLWFECGTLLADCGAFNFLYMSIEITVQVALGAALCWER